MKLNLILTRMFLAASLLAAGAVQAAPPAQTTPPENRFLFLIDTARAMRGYSNAILRDVVELMASDMRGELRPGDTLGIWTYSDKVHGDFPMQVWSPEDKSYVIDQMGEYLVSRSFEKSAHLDRAMPGLMHVIKKSDRFTAILMFDGAEPVQGTPFDKEINALQKKYARDLKREHEPFVLVLAARKGVIFDFTINYPGAIAIPHTALPEKPVATNAPVVVAKVAATNAPPPVKHRRAPSIIMSHGTNVLETPTMVKAATPPAQPTAQFAPPAATDASAAKASTQRTLTPAPSAANPPDKVAAAVPPPASTAVVATPVVTPSPPPSVTTPAPAPAKQAPAVVNTPVPPPPAVSPAVSQPVPSAQSPRPVAATPVTSHATPAPAPAVAPVIPNANLADSAPTGGGQSRLLIVACLLLTAAVVLLLLLLRRPRGGAHASLISQSIDRRRPERGH